MKEQPLNKIKQLGRNEHGNFTIEASLVFPMLVIVSILLLFVSLLFYEKFTLYSTAVITAERAAFTWNNSYKNEETGAYYIKDSDPLYWRTFDDGMSELFNFVAAHDAAKVDIDSSADPNRPVGGLPQQKLLHAASNVPDGMTGQMSYSHTLLKRQIDVHLETPFHLPDTIFQPTQEQLIGAKASAWVAEPVEFIRNLDLLQSYIPLIQKSFKLDQVKKIFNDAESGEKPVNERDLSFNTEREARTYLQKMVNGVERNFSTQTAGKWRKVDALDRDGIAHEAYLGYIANRKTENEQGVRVNEEIAKDVELLRTGQVKGVVWHFYKSKKSGKIGPSGPLLRALEKSGIVVVIHGQSDGGM